MANSGKRNTNTSQFFITLDKADELTGKHTAFGRISGNTIFSRWKAIWLCRAVTDEIDVLSIGELDVDADERPKRYAHLR
jgi:peptidyl-prolyl cis-trans isomerase SDCCAG10